jgi:hypothetical protein
MVIVGSESLTGLMRRFDTAASTLRELETSRSSAGEWSAGQASRVRDQLAGVRDALRGVRGDLDTMGAGVLDASEGIQRIERAVALAHGAVEESPRIVRNRLQDATRRLEPSQRRLDVLGDTGRLADELRADPDGAPKRLVARLERVLGRSDSEFTAEDVRLLAAVDGLPSELRPPMPMPARPAHPLAHQYVHGWLPSGKPSYGQVSSSMDIARWRLSLEGLQLAHQPDAAARIATLLDRIHDVPATDLTIDDLHQLAVIDQLPPALRPDLPAPVTQPIVDLYRESLHEGRLTGQAKLELRSVRLSQAAQRLADEPGASKERFADEVHAIATRPSEELTWDDVVRVGTIERLPAALRPGFPQPLLGPDRQFGRELATVDAPERWRSNRGLELELNNLQLMGRQHELARLPTTTRESMSAELDEMFARPITSLDAEQIRRFATIDGLPRELRPDLPPQSLYPKAPSRLVADAATGSTDEVRWMFETIRSWRETASDAGRADLRERIATGGTVSSTTLQKLGASAELAEGVGITDEQLVALAMRSNASNSGSRNVRADLMVAREALSRLQEPNADLQRIHEQAIAFIDDAVRPGYPEYTQVGRASAMVEFLVRAREAARETAEVAPRDAAETLSW